MATRAKRKPKSDETYVSRDYALGVARTLALWIKRETEALGHGDSPTEVLGGGARREELAESLGVPVVLVDLLTQNTMPEDLDVWQAWPHREAVMGWLARTATTSGGAE